MDNSIRNTAQKINFFITTVEKRDSLKKFPSSFGKTRLFILQNDVFVFVLRIYAKHSKVNGAIVMIIRLDAFSLFDALLKTLVAPKERNKRKGEKIKIEH